LNALLVVLSIVHSLTRQSLYVPNVALITGVLISP